MNKKHREFILEEINKVKQEIIMEVGTTQLVDVRNFRVARLNKKLDCLQVELSDIKH